MADLRDPSAIDAARRTIQSYRGFLGAPDIFAIESAISTGSLNPGHFSEMAKAVKAADPANKDLYGKLRFYAGESDPEVKINYPPTKVRRSNPAAKKTASKKPAAKKKAAKPKKKARR